MSPRLLTLGESMVQLNATTPGPLRYVRTFERHAAGSESNVAIGVVRMGLQAEWFSRVGEDEFGRYLLQTFRGEGVEVGRVITDGDAPTGIYFVQRDFPLPGQSAIYYYRAGSAASRLSPEDLPAGLVEEADALHLTGITLALSPGARRVAFAAAQRARAAGRLVSFDTNLRLKLWSAEEARPHLQEMIGLADVLFVGERDHQALWGGEQPGEEAVRALQERGPRWVILKRGERGALALLDGELHEQPAFRVRVVDKTGAGDAFAAAVLAGRLRGRPPQETLEVAAAAAAAVCTVMGDYEGIPSWEQALGWLRDGMVILR